jgi:DNA-binding beta-propeller fold protein YncE
MQENQRRLTVARQLFDFQAHTIDFDQIHAFMVCQPARACPAATHWADTLEGSTPKCIFVNLFTHLLGRLRLSVLMMLPLLWGLGAQAQTPTQALMQTAGKATAKEPMSAPTPVPTPAHTHPVFVLNSLDASISVIDPVSWKEVKRIPTGKEPHHLYMTPDEKSLIVANALGDSLTFLDPKTAEVQRTVHGILDPYHLRFSPDMKWLVIAANRLNHVDFYRWDGKELTLAKRLSTAKTPSHIWIDASSTTAYFTMQDSDELVAVDIATQSIKWRVPTGKMPADLYGTPDGRHVLVALTGSHSVEVFDVSGKEGKIVQRVKTGDGAHAFRAAGDGRHIFVSNRVANTISKLDMNKLEVVGTFAAPGGPDCMEVVKGGKVLLVTSRWARKLSMIDLEQKKPIQQVNVGKSPHGVWTLDHVPR